MWRHKTTAEDSSGGSLFAMFQKDFVDVLSAATRVFVADSSVPFDDSDAVYPQEYAFGLAGRSSGPEGGPGPSSKSSLFGVALEDLVLDPARSGVVWVGLGG